MVVESFFLRHFRRFDEKAFSFLPGVNFILGPNGSGKTSLLEALSFLSSASSFRTSNLLECIQDKKPHFLIASRFYKKGVEESLQVYLSESSRQCLHHNTPYKSFSPLLGMLPSVLMRPEDISLIRGGPKERRDYLDLEISKKDPLYFHYLKRYQKALKARNILLKEKKKQLLPFWEKPMASASCYLVAARRRHLEALEKEIKAFQDTQESWLLRYRQESPDPKKTELETEEDFLNAFAAIRGKEMIVGSTLVGPQRDDVSFLFNGKIAKTFASDGQARTFIFFLKMAELHLASAEGGEPPLLLIDEWTTSLDPTRRAHLSAFFEKAGQVIMTGLEPLPFLGKATTIKI